MAEIAIVYFSGYGHTAKPAEAVREGVESVADAVANVYRIDEAGDLPLGAVEELGQADAIIYGSPTYMGGPAWQFKKFADASSKAWLRQEWKNKLAAGFTNSASVNGDKFSTIAYFWTLSQQHGQIWIGTGLLPANTKESGPADTNWTAGFAGALAISPADASPDEAPRSGDLATAKHLGKRVAELGNRKVKKDFSELTEQELLALAIALEEEDSRTYSDLAEAMRETYPGTARMFAALAAEENGHRHRLLDLYREKFGDHIPLIRRQDVKGFLERKSLWLLRPLGLDKVRAQAELMEAESKRFYQTAARRSTDAAIRQLLGDLAAEERRHEARAEELEAEYVTAEVEKEEGQAERRLFLLQIVQPALAGLMDGSVSTLAPLFAAALATQQSWPTFLVGLAAAIGAGISMAFAEALSDNGSLTGRGNPWLRGIICGAMTALGGLGHTLPFLVPSFAVAMTIAAAVVAVELAVIAWIRNRYMETPLLSATFQVVGGGLLVFAAGVVIGSG